MSGQAQIFQTSNPTRWNRIKWTARIIGFAAIFLLAVVAIAVVKGKTPSLPNIESRDKIFSKMMNPINDAGFDKKLKKQKGFANELKESHNSAKNDSLIRGVFYSPSWKPAVGLADLEQNGSKFNTIYPEWLFVDTANHLGINSRIDTAGLRLMKKFGHQIMPMLSNFNSSKQDFDGALIKEILMDPIRQNKFIASLIDTLDKYNLQGINIDFEEIGNFKTPFEQFEKNLCQQFKNAGLKVTTDITAGDDNYDCKTLVQYNDQLIIMAYDEYSNAGSGPGPISAQKWIEKVMDAASKDVDASKIIIGISAYGYDWVKDESGKTVGMSDLTYNEALDKAKFSNAAIQFDNDNYNLHYNFDEETDDEKFSHEVWFTDAATTFNILRFADEQGFSGSAMWLLGKEDRRIWNYYARKLSNASLNKQPFDYSTLYDLPIDINQKPTAIGESGGELLRIIYTPKSGKVSLEKDSTDNLVSEEKYLILPSGYVYEKFAEDTTVIGPGHKLILTFDDGPSADFTPKILDILEREKVPATFFVVGLNVENNIPLLKRIYNDGYEIGNHTFTHNNIAKMGYRRSLLEMKTTRSIIEAVTGRSTILFRAPYNADSEPSSYEEIEPIARSKEQNYITVGESIDPNDWDEKNTNADSIVNRTIRIAEAGNSNIILLHDAGGSSREATVQALPRIIQYFKQKGCEFTTVANLMGKTKDDVMPPVKNGLQLKLSYYFSETLYWLTHIVFALFMVGIGLSLFRTLFMAVLAYIQTHREKKLPVAFAQPPVSIIVPAYNEEVNSIRTVESLLEQDYPALEVVFIDDGSKDATYNNVSAHFDGNEKVKVFTKPNGGKSSALNYGIERCSSEYVVCIDADTQLAKNAVTELMKKFASANDLPVGAVAGNVKVGNEVNMITKWQSIEYTTSQNFDRTAFDLLDCITVVPGAIGAFLKKAVLDAGGFTTDTLAEDCDLTMRMHRAGYSVRNCREALSYTEAPETFQQFLKQRFRWSFGVIQSFWKHKDAFLNKRFGNFGMAALPNILVFQILLPMLSPLADVLLVLSLLAAGMGIIPASIEHIIIYYLIFTIVDVLGSVVAFSFENNALKKMNLPPGVRTRENYFKLLWLLPQKLVYRQVMYYILIKSIRKALKGELQGWGTLQRTGNVVLGKG